MKLSILIPTRNRAELLSHAIASVLKQSDPDWELVVSDNASEPDVKQVVDAVDDSRVIYLRSDQPIAVTDNWNLAFEACSGDYVIMLGDDDALLPDYVARVKELVNRFSSPQAIYSRTLLYAWPQADPRCPEGYVQRSGCARFLDGTSSDTEPFVVPALEARRLVKDAMNFRLRYDFNMQYVTFRRDFALDVADNRKLFSSPFPDYYAMNMMFSSAFSVVADPKPTVVVGISRKSYGFFHLRQREQEAKDLLATPEPGSKRVGGTTELLPGTNINNGWLLSMEEVSRDMAGPRLRPNTRRYRILQILHNYHRHYIEDSLPSEQMQALTARLRPFERVIYGAGFRFASALRPKVPPRLRNSFAFAYAVGQRQIPYTNYSRVIGKFEDVTELVEDQTIFKALG